MVKRLFFGHLLALLLLGCESTAPLINRTDEPVLNLVLTVGDLVSTETTVTALLATTGTPTQLEFRTAERFSMRRASDGAVFAWQEVSMPGLPNGLPRLVPSGGNYQLAPRATSAGLGRDSLLAGQRYVLDIMSLGRLITGEVIVPPRPIPRARRTATGWLISWPPVSGSAAYEVAFVANGGLYSHTRTTDTVFAAPPGTARYRITALDPSLYGFTSDSTIVRAGLRGSYGLFGAASSTIIELSDAAAVR